MFTAFEIGDQRYERTGFYYHITKSGKRTKLDVFQAPCPDCGQHFAFGAKRRTNLNRSLLRRCKACRTHRGRNVNIGNSIVDAQLPGPITVPMTRRKTLRNGDALMEPHAAPVGTQARGIDRKSHQPHTPPAQGLMSDG